MKGIADSIKYVKYVFAPIVAGVVSTFSGMLVILLGMILIDYITGISAAYITQTLNAQKSRQGAVRKFATLMAVGAAQLLDVALRIYGVSIPVSLSAAVAGFFVVTEAISFTENLYLCGVRVPSVLVAALLKAKEAAPAASDDDVKKLGAA